MVLGVIADDFTGATDVAGMLVRAGMRTVQTIGVPEAGDAMPEADAVVVALKSRTAPADEAVRDSLAAAHWLRAGGARQLYFKICSTFDSMPHGNIGPVADALLEATGAGIAIACPAFPENGRTVYRGHLFVGDLLLSDTGMRKHPLTPMTDASLVRVLQALGTVRAGELVEACLAEVATLAVADGARRVVVAGGETSGAVVRALGVRQLRIGPTIDPGVPWTMAEGRPLLLALKSGNFGRPDFFAHALAMAA